MQPTSDKPNNFEVKIGDQISGPVSLEQIRQDAGSGGLPPDAQVREVGSSQWLPLSSVLAAGTPATVGRTTSPGRKGPLLAAAIVGALLVLGAGAAVIWHFVRAEHATFPIAANRLPENTYALLGGPIDDANDTHAVVHKMFLAGSLASVLCKPGHDDPVSALLGLGKDKQKALAYFAPSHQKEVRAMMNCGRRMSAGLQSSNVDIFTFKNADNKVQKFFVFRLHADQFPSSLGWVHHEFSTLPGFCHVSKGQKDCTGDSFAVVHSADRWIWGSLATLKTLADSLTQPKKDVSSTVEMLQQATDAISGTSDWSAEATRSSKKFLTSPCTWAAGNVVGSTEDFMKACFPPTGDRQISDIDGEVRAAAEEVDTDLGKAGAIRGRIVLVARDADAAKSMKKDVVELVNDWKAHVENNHAKLVKLATKDAETHDERIWAVVVDVFTRALRNMQVSRAGRVVSISYERDFTKEVAKEVTEAAGKPDKKRLAAATVLAAIEKKQPLPPGVLGQLLGPKLAAFVLSPGLGLDAAEFRNRWNTWLDQAGSNGRLALGDSQPAARGADGAFTVDLAPGMPDGASVTLTGVIDKRSGAVEQAAITKRCSESTLLPASVVEVSACHALIQAVTPGTDGVALFKKLGMVNGKSTSAVRSHVRYSYSSSADGYTETFKVAPLSDHPHHGSPAPSASAENPAPAASAPPSASASAPSSPAVNDKGIPAIPPGKSPPPTTAEWRAAPSVNTEGATAQAHNCSMKIVREWIKVHCEGDVKSISDQDGVPSPSQGYFESIHLGKFADFVFRLQKGRTTKLRIHRDGNRASLFISWPSSADRPVNVALAQIAE